MVSTTIISSVPSFVSPDEHRDLVGATPESFSDIPPVLRHKEENVTVLFDPPLEHLSPGDDSKGVLYVIDRYGRQTHTPGPSIEPHLLAHSFSCRRLAVDSRSPTPPSRCMRYHAPRGQIHPYTASSTKERTRMRTPSICESLSSHPKIPIRVCSPFPSLPTSNVLTFHLSGTHL